MVVEYLMLLAISAVILLVPFVSRGPVTMMSESGPKLGMKVERALVTGQGFFERKGQVIDWQRR